MSYNEELEKAKEELGLKEVEENYEEVVEEDGITQIIEVNGKPVLFDFGVLTGNKILKIKDRYRKIKKSKATMLEEFDDLYYM
uniref:hypothetical protein n=1 Tax=uncultured Fusobacterium sp. TaxID=159267 RepID=UPI0025F2F9EE